MKRIVIIFALLSSILIFPATVFSIDPILHKIDELLEYVHIDDAEKLIQSELDKNPAPSRQADLLWRKSLAVSQRGFIAGLNGESKDVQISLYEEAERYADKAIAVYPQGSDGWFMKAVCIARQGTTRGILESLFSTPAIKENMIKAVNINPDYTAAWYILGMLYGVLPGFPISFGNVEFAVSLGRKAYDLHKEDWKRGELFFINYDGYAELAKNLWNRNWSASRRKAEQRSRLAKYQKAATVLDKACYYEAIADIPDMSDREEALMLVTTAVRALEAYPVRTIYQEQDYLRVREYYDKWRSR